MSQLSDQATRVAFAHALEDWAKEIAAQIRAGAKDDMVALHEEHGVKPKIDVVVPGLGKVGDLSLTFTTDKVVIEDDEAFTAWVEKHYPAAVEYPAPVVRDGWVKMLLGKGVTVDYNSGAVACALQAHQGEIIPGVKAVRGGEPQNVTLTGIKQNLPRLREALISGGGALQLLAGSEPEPEPEPEVTAAPSPEEIGKMKRAEVLALLPEGTTGSLPALRKQAIAQLHPKPAEPLSLSEQLAVARESATGTLAEEIAPGVMRAEALVAARHATVEQGGYSTPEIEAERLSQDRGGRAPA